MRGCGEPWPWMRSRRTSTHGNRSVACHGCARGTGGSCAGARRCGRTGPGQSSLSSAHGSPPRFVAPTTPSRQPSAWRGCRRCRRGSIARCPPVAFATAALADPTATPLLREEARLRGCRPTGCGPSLAAVGLCRTAVTPPPARTRRADTDLECHRFSAPDRCRSPARPRRVTSPSARLSSPPALDSCDALGDGGGSGSCCRTCPVVS